MQVQLSPTLLASCDSITYVRRHAPHSLDFLERLQDGEIFRFSAIPQVTQRSSDTFT